MKKNPKFVAIATPSLFHKRACYIFFLIAFVQLFYLTIFSIPDSSYLITWLIVTIMGWTLLFLSRPPSVTNKWPTIKHPILFQSLFYVTFLSTFLFSRMDYILSTTLYGLDITRLSDSLGRGGWYSYINIFFYPMSLIAMFYRSNRNIFISNMFLVFLICIIDITSIGTRGIPFLVITTFFLLSEKKSWLKVSISLITLGTFFLLAFEWTTRVRAGASGGFVNYWIFKATESLVNRSIIINESFVDYVHQNIPVALPLLYLIAYISHSIPELYRFLSEATEYIITPHFLYLKYHYNMVTWGDTESISVTINQINSSGYSDVGFYQTLYAAFLIDFGLFLLIAILALMAILKIGKVKSLFVFPVYVYFTIVFAFSSISNYFLSGLGPWRFLAFVVLWVLFFHFSFTERSRLRC